LVLYIPARTDSVAREDFVALIIAPVAGGMLFVALVGMVVFVNMARKKKISAWNVQSSEAGIGSSEAGVGLHALCSFGGNGGFCQYGKKKKISAWNVQSSEAGIGSSKAGVGLYAQTSK